MASAGQLIRKILEEFQKGNCQEYDLLLNSLLDPNTTSSTLKNYLNGLTDCVSLINKSKESLLAVIMKVNWLSRGDGVIKAYQTLLINVISANTNYVYLGLSMLVKHFLPEMNGVAHDNDGKYIVDDDMRKLHEERFTHNHVALEDTCKIIPLAPVVLMPILERHFPFHSVDTYVQSCYVKNLIQITIYIPSLRKEILELLATNIMKLDVLSPRSRLHEDEESDDEEIFEMDERGLNEDREEEKKNKVAKKEYLVADCLDRLMEMWLQHIYNICHPDGEFELAPSKKLYWELISVFEKIILPTYESSHTQFIMFYLASFKPVLADGLLDYLWKIVQNPNTPIVFRQAAVCYMASLLARAVYISILTVITCLDLMVSWLHSYLDNLSEEKQSEHLLHGTFYAVSQAAFYVFCFRNSEIFQSKKGYKLAEALNFQRIVTSRLNPLRYCLPIVVSTFSSYTRRHQLAFCDTVIERNNRCMIPVVSNTGLTKTNFTLKLSSFFPFDPYLLPRSGKLIHPIYRIYNGEIQEDSHNTEDEDDFLPADQQTTDTVITTSSFSLLKNITSDDLMMYATSPGFKRL